MVIRRQAEGVDTDALKAEMEQLLYDLANGKSADPKSDEARATRIYEQLTGYKAGCGACIAGRRLFVRSLGSLKDGDTSEALANMRASMRSVTFKFATLRDRILGGK